MSKKIIFIGPSGAGKTTIRKMFFEGENSKKLLEYALEPTYGEESLILRLPGINEEVGIFDLAGQENHRWLESDDSEIFLETEIIIVVIDITIDFELISEFINKVISVRDNISPKSNIYVLLHKIDLIDANALNQIKMKSKNAFNEKKLLKIMFTSLKKQYLINTFSDFLDIMKSCLLERDSENALEINVIDESLKIISIIKQEISVSKKNLIENLNRPEKLVLYLLESLQNKNHILIQTIENNDIISLTDYGRDYFSSLINSFEPTIKNGKNIQYHLKKSLIQDRLPSFLGLLISDKDGRTLLKIESNENILYNLLFSMKDPRTSPISTDLDLIPMFISALEKFSIELNIHDLSGFDLSGSNLKLYIINYENFNLILFMNPDVNFEPFQIKIRNYFHNIFEQHEDLFNKCLKTGQIDILDPISEIIEKWLKDFNNTYQEMIINLEIIDIEHAKSLYDQIDGLYEKINQKFSITLDKIKKLKVNLMKAILEKDYEELKLISTHAKKLSLEYTV